MYFSVTVTSVLNSPCANGAGVVKDSVGALLDAGVEGGMQVSGRIEATERNLFHIPSGIHSWN